MSQPDFMQAPENLAALPRLPRDEVGTVFAEPWQAQAFAMAVKLSEQGHFTWKEWAAALAQELKAAADRGEPDDGTRYYHHWLAALERLVTAKKLSDPAELLARNKAPSREEIIEHMDGNICRCGTYLKIISAIQRASREG